MVLGGFRSFLVLVLTYIFLPPNPAKENLFKRQEFILLVIMSFILVFLTCDSGVIM